MGGVDEGGAGEPAYHRADQGCGITESRGKRQAPHVGRHRFLAGDDEPPAEFVPGHGGEQPAHQDLALIQAEPFADHRHAVVTEIAEPCPDQHAQFPMVIGSVEADDQSAARAGDPAQLA